MTKPWLITGLLAVALLVGAQTTAHAHADLVGQHPDVGATLDSAPERIRLEFSEPIEAVFNPLEVYDEEDERVDLDDAKVEDSDTLSASLGRLSPGETYRVEYRVTSRDGDPIKGGYRFSLSDGAKDADAPPGGGESVSEETEEGGFGRSALYGGLIAASVLAVVGILRSRPVGSR